MANTNKALIVSAALASAMWMPLRAAAASIASAPYGATQQGQAVVQYTLSNARGVTMNCITYGGIITRLDVPDRRGRRADIVLGFGSLGDYEKYNGKIHFGGLIGRYANRIADGRFDLDGHTYKRLSTSRRTRCTAARAVSTKKSGPWSGRFRAHRVRACSFVM